MVFLDYFYTGKCIECLNEFEIWHFCFKLKYLLCIKLIYFKLCDALHLRCPISLHCNYHGYLWKHKRVLQGKLIVISIWTCVASLLFSFIYIELKIYLQAGFPRSRVDDFYMAIQYDPYSDLFFDGSKPSYLYNSWAKLMLR